MMSETSNMTAHPSVLLFMPGHSATLDHDTCPAFPHDASLDDVVGRVTETESLALIFHQPEGDSIVDAVLCDMPLDHLVVVADDVEDIDVSQLLRRGMKALSPLKVQAKRRNAQLRRMSFEQTRLHLWFGPACDKELQRRWLQALTKIQASVGWNCWGSLTVWNALIKSETQVLRLYQLLTARIRDRAVLEHPKPHDLFLRNARCRAFRTRRTQWPCYRGMMDLHMQLMWRQVDRPTYQQFCPSGFLIDVYN